MRLCTLRAAMMESATDRQTSPTRRTCKCVLSTCKNVGKMWGSVRGEYRLSTDLGARRHAVALLVHEELSLRSGCGRATDSPQYG